jgi:hypothetical protein
MKTMKLALLATAALAAVSVSARAETAADISAQLEALTARIAQLEAAPAAPVGYSLLSMSEGEAITFAGQSAGDAKIAPKAHRISLLPAADVPAAGGVDWSMEVRANITFTNEDQVTRTVTDTEAVGVTVVTPPVVLNGPTGTRFIRTGTNFFYDTTTKESDINLDARARIAAHGHTDTSVGKVGVKVRLQGSTEWGGGSEAVMNVGYGYWQMTENLQLIGGYTGSVSGIGYGQDGATFGNTNGPGSMDGDQEQMQLAYASGPLSFAVAIEDGNDHDSEIAGNGFQAYGDLAFAGEVKYSGDAVSGEISVGFTPGDNTDDFWIAGAGMGFALGDMANLSFAAQIDSNNQWNASALATVDVTDAAYLEASVGYEDNSDFVDDASTNINVGAYWAPVDQLTIGVQADHTMYESSADDRTTASLITWFKF